MRKAVLLLLAMLLVLPSNAQGGGTPSLDGLTLPELEALRQEADARIRLLRLPDENGYTDVGDGEEVARNPAAHLLEKIRLDGEILRIEEQQDGFGYVLSVYNNPGRVFLVRYTPKPDERLKLHGDAVTVFGQFKGLSPFKGGDLLEDGAPIVQADLMIARLPEIKPPAADPYAGTREDPAPLFVKAVSEGSYWTDYASFEIEMTSSLRGSAALKKAKEMSSYNISPPKHQEYFMVWLRIRALSSPSGRAEIGNEDFYFVSAGGSEYRQHFLINAPQTLRNLYGGGEHIAVIACLIDKGDTPLIVYSPVSASPLWFDPNP